MKNISFLKDKGVDVDQSLELFGDIETYNETIQEFKNGIDEKISNIKKYYQTENMTDYAIAVHSLKSDCKYFGFMKLAEMALNHEMSSKENNVTYVKENFNSLMKEAQKVRNIVYDYLDDTNLSDSGSLEGTNNNITQNNQSEEKITDGNIILVADDSEVVRIFVKKIFSDIYEIASAKNGEETINIIKEHQNDNLIKAILLDLNMPKVGGFEVLDYLKENDLFDKMPVTIISGEYSSEVINKAFTYDIVDMLNKPFNEEKIKAAVLKTISHKEN